MGTGGARRIGHFFYGGQSTIDLDIRDEQTVAIWDGRRLRPTGRTHETVRTSRMSSKCKPAAGPNIPRQPYSTLRTGCGLPKHFSSAVQPIPRRTNWPRPCGTGLHSTRGPTFAWPPHGAGRRAASRRSIPGVSERSAAYSLRNYLTPRDRRRRIARCLLPRRHPRSKRRACSLGCSRCARRH